MDKSHIVFGQKLRTFRSGVKRLSYEKMMENREYKANKCCDHLNGKVINNMGYMPMW